MKRLLIAVGVLFLSASPFAATLTVCSGGGCTYTLSQFQTAINAANCNDTISIAAGQTIDQGVYYLPAKGCTGSSYVDITTTGWAKTAGVRVAPADATSMARFIDTGSTDPVFYACFNADNYRFRGLELAATPVDSATDRYTYSLVITGQGNASAPCNDTGMVGGIYADNPAQLPVGWVFDQVYCHATTTGDYGRCMLFSGGFEVKNSDIREFKGANNGDSNCIQSSGIGPQILTNNFLQCAGENYIALFNQHGDATGMTDAAPGPFTVRNNKFTKRCSWFPNAALMNCGEAYAGTAWGIKNTFELKACGTAGTLIDHNIFENSYHHATQGQEGHLIVINVRNNITGNSDWNTCRNLTFSNNIVRNGGGGFQLLLNTEGNAATVGMNWWVINTLIYGIDATIYGGQGNLIIAKNGQVSQAASGIQFIHDTFHAASAGNNGKALSTDSSVDDTFTNGIFRDTILPLIDYGLFSSETVNCNGTAYLALYWPGVTWQKMLMPGLEEVCGAFGLANYPNVGTDTLNITRAAATAGFENPAVGDYRLKSTATGYRAATDGTDIGVNMCNGAFPDPAGDGSTTFSGANCNTPVKLPIPVRMVSGSRAPVPPAPAERQNLTGRLWVLLHGARGMRDVMADRKVARNQPAPMLFAREKRVDIGDEERLRVATVRTSHVGVVHDANHVSHLSSEGRRFANAQNMPVLAQTPAVFASNSAP